MDIIDMDQFFASNDNDIIPFTQTWDNNMQSLPNINPTKKRERSSLRLKQKESKKIKTQEISHVEYLQNTISHQQCVINNLYKYKEENDNLCELLKISQNNEFILQSKSDEITMKYIEENNKIYESLKTSQSEIIKYIEENNKLDELLKISQNNEFVVRSKLDEITEENNKVHELSKTSQLKLNEIIEENNKLNELLKNSQNNEFMTQLKLNEIIEENNKLNELLKTSQNNENKIVISKKYECDLDTIYTWNILKEQSSKCMEIYGFTSNQISTLYEYIIAIINTKNVSKKGCKPKYSHETKFLIVLYFLVHNTTLKQIANKFQMSSTTIQEIITTTIHQCSSELFIKSNENDDKCNLIYQSYIIPVNNFSDNNIISKCIINGEKIYGIYIHCIHNSKSGKIIYFDINNKKDVDTKWLKKYRVQSKVCTTNFIATFGKRMKNKFSIMSSKYRGDLTELYGIIQFVIALINMDLEFNNDIIENKKHDEITLD